MVDHGLKRKIFEIIHQHNIKNLLLLSALKIESPGKNSNGFILMVSHLSEEVLMLKLVAGIQMSVIEKKMAPDQ